MNSVWSIVIRAGGLVLLYILAAPTYLVIALAKLVRNAPASRAIRDGTIRCPHCGETNDLDIGSTCPRCHRAELGNRLRCSCGYETSSFNCDSCGYTIDVL